MSRCSNVPGKTMLRECPTSVSASTPQFRLHTVIKACRAPVLCTHITLADGGEGRCPLKQRDSDLWRH